MVLKIGDIAPDFTVINDQNERFTLGQLRGKKVVLYFYPKDHTPGCTQQACDFRDAYARFKEQGVVVIGISKDSVKTHLRFKDKYSLPFMLLVDSNAEVCMAYNVISKKSLFGKSFLGIQRSTFYIDDQGIVRGIWRKVKVKNHAQEVLMHIANEIQLAT